MKAQGTAIKKGSIESGMAWDIGSGKVLAFSRFLGFPRLVAECGIFPKYGDPNKDSNIVWSSP